MPRFAANLSTLFGEAPFLDRFERAAKAGFAAVEVQFPYPFAAREVKARLQANGLRLVLHNLPPGERDGDRGIACDPARIAEFRDGVARAVEYASVVGAPRLNCLAGVPPADVSTGARRETFVANVAYAADALRAAGIDLLIEPINAYDVPGFWLNRIAQAVEVLDEVGAANAYVQHDLYHAQRTDGELAATLERHLPRIGHVQIADNPGRHEPGTGEINFAFLFAHLDRLGYEGWVGCEYRPKTTTEEGLGWLAATMRA